MLTDGSACLIFRENFFISPCKQKAPRSCALISHVPGEMGVFESMILLPLVLAALLLGGNELLQKKNLVGHAVRLAGRWGGNMVPQLLAATTLVSGAMLLFSVATPEILPA